MNKRRRQNFTATQGGLEVLSFFLIHITVLTHNVVDLVHERLDSTIYRDGVEEHECIDEDGKAKANGR